MNNHWLGLVMAKREAEAEARPIEDRILMFKTDGSAQRQRIWQLRAELGLTEHPEWADDRLAEEYVGASVEFVVEARKRRSSHGGTYTEKTPQPSPELEADRRKKK